MKKFFRRLFKAQKSVWLILVFCLATGCSRAEGSQSEVKQLSDMAYQNEKTVEFNDPVLEKAIKKSLDQKQIYESDLEKVTSLSISNYNKIKDWDDLEKFQNLEGLTITDCGVTDISFIEKLPKLVEVNFSNNTIKSIESIEVPDTLRNLILSNNRITELSFLEDFSQIRLLSISGNMIENIDGVEYCENLQYLDLRCNKISSVEGIEVLENLHTLYLDEEVEREGSIDFMIGNFRNGDVTTKQYLLKEQYDLE